MEQNNYLEFEKSKAAVYTIMEACFQDVFDLEDDELGSFHDEIDEYMNQNQKGSWLPENQMITDRFYEWLFEELPYFYVGLLTRPVLVNWLFKVMYESEKKNNKMQAYEVNPEFVDRSFPSQRICDRTFYPLTGKGRLQVDISSCIHGISDIDSCIFSQHLGSTETKSG